MNSPSLHKKKAAFKKWQRTRTNEHRNLNKNDKKRSIQKTQGETKKIMLQKHTKN